MFWLHRIIELQAKTVTRYTTDTQEEYDYIEGLLEEIKPTLPQTAHHYLIATSFRYRLPVQPQFQARFRPPYFSKNSFYGTKVYPTAAYEVGYHFLRQRVHLKGLSQDPESRTHYRVAFSDSKIVDIHSRKDLKKIMDPNDYTASHQFVLKNSKISSIMYPSCRDPQKRACVITFDIHTLGKTPRNQHTIHFIYDESNQKCRVIDPTQKLDLIEIKWHDFVSAKS